jgi:hypothetical protein
MAVIFSLDHTPPLQSKMEEGEIVGSRPTRCICVTYQAEYPVGLSMLLYDTIIRFRWNGIVPSPLTISAD